jgi:hypothetical protein
VRELEVSQEYIKKSISNTRNKRRSSLYLRHHDDEYMEREEDYNTINGNRIIS